MGTLSEFRSRLWKAAGGVRVVLDVQVVGLVVAIVLLDVEAERIEDRERDLGDAFALGLVQSAGIDFGAAAELCSAWTGEDARPYTTLLHWYYLVFSSAVSSCCSSAFVQVEFGS